MWIDGNRRKKREIAAAVALLGAATILAPGALAQSAGAADRGAPANSAVVERAAGLFDEGRWIEARESLDALAGSGGSEALSDAERGRAVELLKKIDARLRTADPLEVSLQRSEWALGTGDLAQAARHAKAVQSKSFADAAQRARAEGLLASVSKRRAELEPLIPGMLAQARADFGAERFGAAKASLLTIARSGIALDAGTEASLAALQSQIVDAERVRGTTFEIADESGMAMLQPGKVRRSGGSNPAPSPQGEPAGGTPEAAPEWEPLVEPQPALAQADEPPPPPPPAAPAQSAPESSPPPASAQPVGTPAASTAPQDDLITQAMRAEALRYMAEGDEAYDQARYSVAIDRYTLALAQFRQYLTAADASRAESRITEARVRLGSAQPGNLADQTIGTLQLQRQQATAAFENDLNEAQSRLKAGDVARATSLAERARLTVSGARNAFSDAEYDAFIKRLDDFGRQVESQREQIAREEAARKEKENAERAQAAEATRAAERDRKVNEAIARVRALQVERKFKDALQVCEQALFLDPNNPTALLLRDLLRDITVYERYNRTQEAKAYNAAIQTLDNEDAMVMPAGVLDFPVDWPSKTFHRGETAAFADTPENRKVLAAMSGGSKFAIDFRENRFEDVLTFLAKVSNLTIDPDWENLANVGVERDSLVTLRLPPVNLETALNKVLGKLSRDISRPGWAVSEGVIVVSSEEALRKQMTLVIYSIEDLIFLIPNYPDVPQVDLNSVLQQGQGGSGQSPFTNVNQNQNITPQQIEQQRLERIRKITDIIQSNVDPDSWRDTGGGDATIQELNNSLIIKNTPKNHREIIGLLSKLREIRNLQINVETKFLLVNQSWFEQVGFDLDIIFNTGSNQVQALQTALPNSRPSDLFNFAGTGGAPRGLQRTVGTTAVVPPNNWSPIGAQQNSLGLANLLGGEGGFAADVLAVAPALGIAGQFLDDIQVDFLVQATQADKRTVQLTAPRLTFTNGQTANIYVVTQQAFVSDLQPVTGDNAVGFDPTVSTVSEGVTLLVEGVVSADRRWVTMNIDAGVARIDGFDQQEITAIAGGQLVPSGQVGSFIQLPTVTVTRVRTTSTVPDEGTILLGGQRLITEVEVETGVPVLSKIPIINRFFTNRIESKEEQTLLILMKPTILIQSEEEEKAFPGLMDSIRTGTFR